jgi:phosphoribosyl-AMP cyclohydrolase
MSKEYTHIMEADFGGDGKALLPVVTQDIHSREVLILSYVNREAFEETRRSGYATFWSRSRNEIWKKGLTSGNMLIVKEIRINCEQNSLLFLVEQEGTGACHAKRSNGGYHTGCYYRKVMPDGSLEFLED